MQHKQVKLMMAITCTLMGVYRHPLRAIRNLQAAQSSLLHYQFPGKVAQKALEWMERCFSSVKEDGYETTARWQDIFSQNHWAKSCPVK